MILGLIPARAGSKGIKDKNIYPLCGVPLIQHTYMAANASYLDDFVISSDMRCIRDKYWSKYYLTYIERPIELCGDDVPMLPVIAHAMKYYEESIAAHAMKYFEGCCPRTTYVDAIMLLQPTSPLRTVEDINNAITLYKEKNATCLYSGFYMGIKTDKPYDKHTAEKHFQRNGSIFISSRELIEQGKLWDETAIKYEMPFSRSIDIDTYDDLFMAEALLQYRLNGGQI